MRLRLLAQARADLADAMTWYKSKSEILAQAFLGDFEKTANLIESHPLAWSEMSEGVRRCRFSRFPYALIYVLEKDQCLVLAVAHLHRKPGYWHN